MSESTETIYRVKIALQLSFIVWVMLVVFIFYATFETTIKMYGTFFVAVYNSYLHSFSAGRDRL
ncbi:hypothetical protein [Methanosarcina barkeri]|uniref:hypothetical protein n=1 Tax=Methanosarcina barkeri TaxID=2208 RepID=UPI001FB53FF0|nr:hypothetical protein [Methanosarcina barkeri]